MSLPTKGEVYSRLVEHLRLAQEDAAMLMMINQAEGDGPGMAIARGWFMISELLKKVIFSVTMLATKGVLQ